jgi:hypothetical protein
VGKAACGPAKQCNGLIEGCARGFCQFTEFWLEKFFADRQGNLSLPNVSY